ncbi:MAG TPA: hypothetical protein VE988_02900, partial [Gemmataceae bacterium]|nr:hypothetical protein [Gemmataceae bacterium]
KLLLKKLDSPLGGEKLQTLRAIIILEANGSKEAKALLRTLADGDPGSRVTASAQAALQRIK